MTPSRREYALSLAFALWGLAIAISLYTFWARPAPPGQLPGLGTRFNYDAHGPFRWVVGLMLIPIVVAFVLRPVARRLAEADTRAWARNLAMIAPLVALWSVTISRTPSWVIVPYALVIAACVFLRRRDLAFTRHDAVLLPVLLTAALALNDVAPKLSIDRVFVLAALLVLALRIAVTPALAFVLAPLGLVLQTSFFARDQRYFGWHALAIVVITPFVMRFVLRDPRKARRALALVIFPLSLYAYINATSIQTAEGQPRVNVFEESHSLLPASEYLAGELPYRDILPAHGLLEDGFLDFLIMRVRPANIGTTWKARLAIGTLNAIVLYFLVLVMTGSAEAAFFGVFLTLLTGVFTPSVRLLPSLITLVLILGAVRLRRPHWFRYAGIGIVISGITSLDFAAYTFVTLLVAILRFRENVERRALSPPGGGLRAHRSTALQALAGMAIAAVPLFLGFAFLGILDDFFRGTFVEVLSLGPVYALTMFLLPPVLEEARTFPEALIKLLHRDGFLYLFWCVCVVFVAATVTRRARRRVEPFVLAGVWIVLSAISYAERHHLYFASLAPAIVVAATYLFLVRRRSALAPVVVAALIVLAAPTTHIGVVGWMRDARGPVEPGWVEIPDLPRARGAYFLEGDAHDIAAVRKYLSLTLGPDETFLDFTNRGLLYFLFRRDCPIRYYEVAFYETEERQREVIRRIENDPRVRAVLLPGPSHRYIVDGVLNQERAPLVWQYLQTRFHPDFAEGDVVFWRRNL